MTRLEHKITGNNPSEVLHNYNQSISPNYRERDGLKTSNFSKRDGWLVFAEANERYVLRKTIQGGKLLWYLDLFAGVL